MRHPLRRLAALICMFAIAATPAIASQNGRLPAAALARVAGPTPTVHVFLHTGAPAASWNTMVLLAHEQHAAIYPGGPLSAYRPLAAQKLLRTYWCNRGHCENAALPGTSNHGLGIAVDLALPRPMRAWLDRHGAYFGWAKRWSDAPWEPWHIRYRPHVWRLRPNPGIDPAHPLLRLGSGGRGQSIWVKRLQRELHLLADGELGPATARALQRFQTAHHLHATGITTPGTWRALYAHLHSPAARPRPPAKRRPAPRPRRVQVTPALGVDVSVYQGNVNWTAVKKAGVRFVVAKTTEGLDYRDPRWTGARVHAIRTAGLILGVYHFLRPRAGRDPRAEARHAVHVARAGGWNPKRDLPLTEDLESTTISMCQTMTYGARFAAEVRRLTGRWPILYSYPGFLNTAPASCRKQLAHLRLWIAHYRVPKPLVPWPWSHPGYAMWQYDDSGRIPGIHGHVDLSLIAGGVPRLEALAHPR